MDGNTTGNLLRHSRPRRHRSFIDAGFLFNCHMFGDQYKDKEEACRFVKNTESCNIMVNFIDYLDFMVCEFNLHDKFLWMILFTLLIISFYSFVLVIISKYFVVPNILTLARNTQMSGYNLGYIVLSSIIVYPFCIELSITCHGHLAFSAKLVADFMAVTFPMLVAGIHIIASPREVVFRVRPKLFCWNLFMMVFGLITLVNVLSPKETSRKSIHETFYAMLFATIYFVNVIFLMKKQPQARHIQTKRRSIDSDEYETQPVQETIAGDPWNVFLQTISPYRNNIGNFCYIVIITPIWFILSLFVPVVTKKRHLNGWCKVTTLINILLFPMLLFTTRSEIFFYCLALFCLLVAILVAALTYVHQKPPFHDYLAVFGIIAGVYIFLDIDDELICLFWQVLNYLVDWRADAVFLVSPLGIIITVAIICQALVENGLADVAYGMIIGTITLTIYCTHPLITVNLCFRHEGIMTPITSNIQTTFHYLMITLFILFCSVTLTNFQIRKSHSYFLCVMFLVYYIFVFCCALQLLHPLGSQHSIVWDHFVHIDWA